MQPQKSLLLSLGPFPSLCKEGTGQDLQGPLHFRPNGTRTLSCAWVHPEGLRLGGVGREKLSEGLGDEGRAIEEYANFPGFIPGKEDQLSNVKPALVGGQVPQSQATPQKLTGGKNVPAVPRLNAKPRLGMASPLFLPKPHPGYMLFDTFQVH